MKSKALWSQLQQKTSLVRGPWLFGLLLAIGISPALGVLAANAQEGDEPSAESSEQARKRVLAHIAADPSVLINVTDREMPSSPDIINLGKRSSAALERCLSDNADAQIRRTCAILLGQLGDRRALPTLHTALDDWEPQVRYSVIHALRRIPDKSSFDHLMKIYHREDEDANNKKAVIDALGSLSDTRALSVLREALHKEPEESKPDLREEAFDSLWRSRHLMAPTTLVGDVSFALKSTLIGLVRAGTEVSAELRSPQLVPALIPLMSSPDVTVRNKAVYALGRIGDRKATAALLAKLPNVREARMLNNIAFALEKLDRDAFFPSIKQLIEHKQAIIRLNAAFVVGDVKRTEGIDLLRSALKDPSDLVKTGAIVGLGKIGSPSAIQDLEPFADHPNLAIRQEAIYALVSLSGGTRSPLLFDKLFQSKNEQVKRRAALALGNFGDVRMRGYLLSCLESKSCSLNEVQSYLKKDKDDSIPGRLLLAWARGNDELSPVLADMRPAGTVPIVTSSLDSALARHDRRHAKVAIDLVGDLGDASVRNRLYPGTIDPDTWLRVHAAVATSRLGDPDADRILLRDLDNLAVAQLPFFVQILARIREPAVQARLLPELQKRFRGADIDIAVASAAIHLSWNPDDAIFRMLEALSAPTSKERDLAEHYLRSNDSEKLTWLLRRALARETRPHTRDRLRKILDLR